MNALHALRTVSNIAGLSLKFCIGHAKSLDSILFVTIFAYYFWVLERRVAFIANHACVSHC